MPKLDYVDLKSLEPEYCLSVLVIALKLGNVLSLKYPPSNCGRFKDIGKDSEPKHAEKATIHGQTVSVSNVHDPER